MTKEKITVLYLQGFTLFGKNRKQQLFERALGKENVITSEVSVQPEFIIFSLFLLLIIVITGFNIYIALLFLNKLIISITIVNSILVVGAMYYNGFYLILYHIMKTSLKRTEQTMFKYNPDVVIGVSFGAVVAMNLEYKQGKKPLILISPSINSYQKYTHNTETDLSSFPYVLIIQGSKDKTNSLSACAKLIASLPHEHGRIEIIDDNSSYSNLKESDIKTWVEEANCNSFSKIDSLFRKDDIGIGGKKIEIGTKTLSSKYITVYTADDMNDISEESPPLV